MGRGVNVAGGSPNEDGESSWLCSRAARMARDENKMRLEACMSLSLKVRTWSALNGI